MVGGAERLVIDICNELDKRNDTDVKLLVLSDRIDFDDKTFKFDYSIIKSHISLSLKDSNKADLNEFEDVITEFEPDIIHSHLFEAELISRWKVIPNITYVTHCHDNMSQMSGFIRKKTFKKNITDFYEKKLLFKRYKDCNNNFIAISKNTNDYIKKVIPKTLKKNIFLLSNAVDVKRFYDAGKKTYREIRMINIGSFVKKKNQAFAVKVLKNIIDKGFNANLTFLGDGELRNEVENLAIKLGVINNIKFIGNVPNPEDYLKESNIYLHTATYEPFGLVILEAMAAGLPVISLDGKGNKDIIINGKNGVIINEENITLFTQIIISIFEDKNFKSKLIDEGYKTAVKHDIKNYVDKLFSIYKEAISLENSV